ncbi:hypothetical protein [Halosegnis marinus]
MDEDTAESVLAVEETASLVGFVVGGVSLVIAVGTVLVAHLGPGAVETLTLLTVNSPYGAAPLPFPFEPAWAGVASWLAGLALHLAAVLLGGQ